jgi:hypothetical protein
MVMLLALLILTKFEVELSVQIVYIHFMLDRLQSVHLLQA